MEEFGFKPPHYFSDKDETKLQIVFPEEIWLLILNKITDSDHYHCICAASPYFCKLLLPQRSRVLFPSVTNLCKTNMLSRKTAFSSLLKCRAVCKAWKQGVDALFHHILSKTYNKDPNNWKLFGHPIDTLNSTQELIFCSRKFSYESKLEQLLKHFHNSHFLTRRNPFPSRSIHYMFLAIPSTINRILVEVLKTYGHHIWHCSVRFWCFNQNEIQPVMRIFRSFLELLPNLQTLRIECVMDVSGFEDFLQNTLAENPLPKLKKIQLLDERGLAQPVFSQLIQNNSHIKKLSVYELNSDRHSALFSTPLPKLEEFHCVSLKSAEDFSKLTNLEFHWPLKKLTIGCHPTMNHANTLFGLIETKWAETLIDLNIIISTKVSFLNMNPLRLPHLQNLKIKMSRYACMDFILPMANSLVSLSIILENFSQYEKRIEEDSIIKFFLHRRNLSKSNIWQHLPKLRVLKYAGPIGSGVLCDRTYQRRY